MFFIETIGILILIFQDKENVLYKNNSNPYSDIISIQNILFVQNTRKWINIILGQKRMFFIEIIAILILIFQDKENVLYKITAILILILVLYKHSLCPRIIEQGLLLLQDKENVLYRNNSNPYSDIIYIQTFSLSQNTRTWITTILVERECFVQK